MSTTNPPLPDIQVDPRIYRHLADAQVNVELDTGDMILNLGPQHPATHGTLRIVVRLDGERVIAADPVIGYMHRGYEKLTEFRTYPQITTLINRIDWLSSFANEVPFIDAAEQLLGIEAPPRAQYIRTILTELSRIATFLLFLGEMGLQVGALTPAFYGFRDREHILNLIEAATGGRFHPNFNRIGGLKDDLPWGWINDTRTAMKTTFDACDTFDDLVAGNEIFEMRTRSIGIIPAELGAAYGVSGSNLRASGVDWDLRRDGKPYLAYPEHRLPGVDASRRRLVRARTGCGSRRRASRRAWCSSCSTSSRAARSWRRCRSSSRCRRVRSGPRPRTRSARWATTWCRRARPGPFRVKIRSASFSNVSILPWLLRGVYVADVVTILASLYFILGDIDR